MSVRTRLGVGLVLVGWLVSLVPAGAQEGSGAPTMTPEQMAAAQAMMAAGAPGPEHQWLASMAGKCEYVGGSTDPMTGQLTTQRFVSEHTADREVHAIYAPGPDGKEWKMMELVYTRKK
jgi:hypothetical protein